MRPEPSLTTPFEKNLPPLHKILKALWELPQRVRRLAIAPATAVDSLADSVTIEMLRGLGRDGALCFYRHQTFVQPALKETVTAVRTRYGYWLCRTQRHEFEARAVSRRVDSGFVPTTESELPRLSCTPAGVDTSLELR